MFAIVTVKVADIIPGGDVPLGLEAEVLKDLIYSSIIDEGFEDVSVHVTVVPEDEGILPKNVKAQILEVDYAASEQRILDMDLHSAKARELFGEDYTPEQREEAKKRVFRALYGGSWKDEKEEA